jgi:hemolysin III
MGWLIIIALEPLNNNLEFEGILWLLGGGFSYSIGVVFYLLNRLPYNHAIFHIWVLIGSFAHFIAVYRYVLPW